ncbi:E3 ubiquitin-protein ligase RNF14 [Linum perenne]
MPKGESRDSIVESSHLPSISPPQPQPGSRRPARRRRNASSKKGYVKKSDLGSPISPKIEVGLPSAGEFPAEEGDGVKEKEKEKIPLESEIWASECGGGVADVISVLEELQLAEEPELSADQLRVNDQLQEDELLAMESIYGEKVVILDRLKGLRSFQIHIETKVAKELTITTNLKSKMKTESTSTDDFSYSFKVKFLPPIVLTCTLPRSYPSHKPPCFTISIQWLDSLRISELCSVLDSIWMEQLGQEVIYQWVDWLQTNSLSHLGIHQEMALGPYGTKRSGDRRAISGIVSPDVDVPSLKRYSDEQGIESFLNNLQECCICFSEQAGEPCLTPELKMHILQNRLNSSQINEKQKLVEMNKINEFLNEKAIARDSKQCPICRMAISRTGGCNKMVCAHCGNFFCYACNKPIEGYEHFRDEKCELFPEDTVREWEEQMNVHQVVGRFRAEQNIGQQGHPCPLCSQINMKEENNNHILCWSCRTHYCYLCRKAVKRASEHFGPKGCKQHSAG